MMSSRMRELQVVPSTITTASDYALGVLAQSIGGGGGIAGDSSRLLQLVSTGWLALDEGGQGSGNGT